MMSAIPRDSVSWSMDSMFTDPLQTAQLGRDLVAVELRNCDFVVKGALVDRRPTLFDERAGVRRQVRASAKRRGTWQTSTAYGAKVAIPELRGPTWVFADEWRDRWDVLETGRDMR